MTKLQTAWVLMVAFALVGLSKLPGQNEGRTASVTGVLKSRIEVKNSKNLIIEVLADGDEKSRRYGVPYVPKGKGPITEVLAAVSRATLGDRVHCKLEYGAYGYEGGFTVTAFEVLRKADIR